VLRAEDFASLLQSSLEARLVDNYEAADQPLSEAEVNEWLVIFKKRDHK